MKLELVVDDKLATPAIDVIIQSAAIGKIGDGKMFLSKVATQGYIETCHHRLAPCLNIP